MKLKFIPKIFYLNLIYILFYLFTYLLLLSCATREAKPHVGFKAKEVYY